MKCLRRESFAVRVILCALAVMRSTMASATTFSSIWSCQLAGGIWEQKIVDPLQAARSYTELPGVGHTMMFQQPEAFGDAVASLVEA